MDDDYVPSLHALP